ncbi:MAG TPA: host attachment protein [Caulobacteraceae bacterium]|nr:host attachment protein [Caulobacteraceae bacterium]
MKAPRTWYVVTDGGRARFLQKRDAPRAFAAAGTAFDTHREFVSAHIHDRTHDLGAERPGRSYGSRGSVRHAVQPREDLHRTEKRTFVDEVAAALNDANARDEFDRLILVAPAHALSELHQALDAPTRRKVAAQLQKDLTQVPEANLAEHFADVDGG